LVEVAALRRVTRFLRSEILPAFVVVAVVLVKRRPSGRSERRGTFVVVPVVLVDPGA